MSSIWIFYTFIVGVILMVQVGFNTQLAKGTSSLWSAFISFGIGFLLLGALIAVLKIPAPTMSDIQNIPKLAWLGGVLGAIYVASSILIAPQLGTALMFALIVAGQLSAALICDHFGLLDLPKIQLTWQRLVGVMLVFSGIIIMRWA